MPTDPRLSSLGADHHLKVKKEALASRVIQRNWRCGHHKLSGYPYVLDIKDIDWLCCVCCWTLRESEKLYCMFAFSKIFSPFVVMKVQLLSHHHLVSNVRFFVLDKVWYHGGHSSWKQFR